MTLREQVGTLLMTAGTVAEVPHLRALAHRNHLGGVMVRGRSTAPVPVVASAVRRVQRAAPRGLPLLVATDQEGGLVQVLQGAGFPRLPTAVEQGAWSTARLRATATRSGAALRRAGITLDLAPVADVPCAAYATHNPPIADLYRQYSARPARAARSVVAVMRGLRRADVATAVKHFPGLGCVGANTDTSAHVVDTRTGPDSPRLAAFAAAVTAGTRVVMVSSATYRRIDPAHPAVYSARTMRLLRRRLGFGGVIMSDDVGGAVAVQNQPPGIRAVRFVRAGGDLLLDIVPGDVPAMTSALAQEARSHPAFALQVRRAATRVVALRLASR